jgi:hypothetical protein
MMSVVMSAVVPVLVRRIEHVKRGGRRTRRLAARFGDAGPVDGALLAGLQHTKVQATGLRRQKQHGAELVEMVIGQRTAAPGDAAHALGDDLAMHGGGPRSVVTSQPDLGCGLATAMPSGMSTRMATVAEPSQPWPT